MFDAVFSPFMRLASYSKRMYTSLCEVEAFPSNFDIFDICILQAWLVSLTQKTNTRRFISSSDACHQFVIVT